ncbi:MAG: phosphatidate cytidylyltransferase [Ignavibacteriales bacterium]|nr:phosphatidate cytidylyltransferase [Ignavibacteriales bacterium]
MENESTKKSRFSSLPTRVAVAAVAIPAIVVLALEGGYWFFGLVALISSLSLAEFYKLSEKKNVFPLASLGLFFGILMNLAFIYERLQLDLYQILSDAGIRLSMFSQLQFFLVVVLLFTLTVLLTELFRDKGSPTLNIAVTVFGVLGISVFFGTLIGLREIFPYGFPVYKFFSVAVADTVQLDRINRWGGYTVVSLLAAIWVCDTAAYFGGVTFGRHKLLELVSPGKTWEGGVFGFVFAVATMVVAQSTVLDYLEFHHAIVIGVFVGIFGQLGDLVESRFKRDAGVKDSSSIIPGHGGMYDRFDSLVFLSPIVYLYIDFVVLS